MRCALLLLLVACGDNTIPHAAYEARSGSRIAVQVFAYSDGSEQWDPDVFFDRERDETCTAQRWTDGFTYCTPIARPTIYTGPNCIDGELGRWLVTQAPPAYFYRELSLPNGDLISRLFVRGDAVEQPATPLYEIQNGRCLETPAGGWNYYALGAPVVADEFARIKRVAVTDDDARLALDAFTTDDGFYMPNDAFLDRTLGNECRVAAGPNLPSTICEPTFAGEAEFSRDPQCATKDIMVIELLNDVPEVVVTDTDGCRTYRQRGAEIAAVPLFLPLGPTCVAVNLPSDAHLFEVGAEFEPAPLARRHERSSPAGEPSRRLQRILLSDGTSTIVDSLFFDRELGVDCARVAIGGGYRCLPANTFASVLPYFSDAACTQPMDISLVESGACDAPTRFAIDFRGLDPIVRPLVAPYAFPLYEISTADTCAEYIPPKRQKPYTLGAAMPPEAFVDATLTTR